MVSSGITVSGETVTSGLTQTVLSGGSTSSTTILSAADQTVSGGTAIGTLISSGGVQYVDAGTASGTALADARTERTRSLAAWRSARLRLLSSAGVLDRADIED